LCQNFNVSFFKRRIVLMIEKGQSFLRSYRSQMRGLNQWKTRIIFVFAFMLIFPLVVFADNLVVDGDGLVPVTPNALNLGSICQGQNTSGNALLAIQRVGSGTNVYANNSSVTISAGIPSDPNVTASFTDNGIALPGNWTSVSNNVMSTDTATSQVTVVADGLPGAKSAAILYSATGINTSSATLVRSTTLTINWTVAVCDTTPPVITPTVTGTLGNNGWYVGNVNISWAVTDAESAVSSQSGCTNSVINSDTAGQTFTCTATSTGGTNSQSVTIKRDATAPTISGAASPIPNGAGWNNSDVTVSFSCADNLSGLASCGPNQTLNGDGLNQSVTGNATDNAGNTASSAVSGINIDKTAPSVSASSAPTANGMGWNNSDVTISFSGTDALSGIDSCSGPVVLSGEGSGQSASGSCKDLAGNSGGASANNINIDKTAPMISITGVVHGSVYVLGTVPMAGCTTSDGLSGVANFAALSGGGSGVGTFTSTCSGGVDNASNMGALASATYTVIYSWNGFFQPVENPGPGPSYVYNRVKAGSAIPLKFSLSGDQGLAIFMTGYPRSEKVSCSNVAVMDDVTETVTAGNSSLSYDATADQYNYVWKSEKAWSGTCRKLTLRLVDGKEYIAYFNFTK
jgi:hypothetical protein